MKAYHQLELFNVFTGVAISFVHVCMCVCLHAIVCHVFRGALFFSNEIQQYTVPFMGSDPSVVKRTQRYLVEEHQTTPVSSILFHWWDVNEQIRILAISVLCRLLNKPLTLGSIWSLCRNWRHRERHQADVCRHDVLAFGQVQLWT